MLRLLRHGAARRKRDKARKSASDLAIAAGHLPIAGIISADPKKVNIMDLAAEVRTNIGSIARGARDRVE